MIFQNAQNLLLEIEGLLTLLKTTDQDSPRRKPLSSLICEKADALNALLRKEFSQFSLLEDAETDQMDNAVSEAAEAAMAIQDTATGSANVTEINVDSEPEADPDIEVEIVYDELPEEGTEEEADKHEIELTADEVPTLPTIEKPTDVEKEIEEELEEEEEKIEETTESKSVDTDTESVAQLTTDIADDDAADVAELEVEARVIQAESELIKEELAPAQADSEPAEVELAPVNAEPEPVKAEPAPVQPLPARSAKDLLATFTLNDKYRFRRELFGNSDAEFRNALDLITVMQSPAEAEDYFCNELGYDIERPIVKEFIGLISAYLSSN